MESLNWVLAQIAALDEMVSDNYYADAIDYRKSFLELLDWYGWEVIGTGATLKEEGYTYIIEFNCKEGKYTLYMLNEQSKQVRKQVFYMQLV